MSGSRIPLVARHLCRAGCVSGALLVGAALAPAAWGHPTDEANVYQYLWIELDPRGARLTDTIVVGGLVVGRFWAELDPDSDRVLSVEEQQRFSRRIAAGIRASVDGRPLPLRLQRAEYPDAESFFGHTADGSPAPLHIALRCDWPPLKPGAHALQARNDSLASFARVFPEPIVRSAGVEAGAPVAGDLGRDVRLEFHWPPVPSGGVQVRTAPLGIGANVHEIPGPGMTAPFEQTPLFRPGQPLRMAVPPADRSPAEAPVVRRFRQLLGDRVSPWAALLALGAALVAGAAHALTPGHGKAMAAAYLAGTRGTIWDAVLLGLIVTVTHTGSVFILGLLSLLLLRSFPVEVVGTWLSLFSGVLVLLMGFVLFQRALFALHEARHATPTTVPTEGPPESPPPPDDPHSHRRGSAFDHALDHALGRPHSHAHEGPGAGHSGPAPTGAATGRWGLVGMGVAGGMVPCFDAIAILLVAVHLRQVVLGMAVILAFSVGMAAVLIGAGVLVVTAGNTLRRFRQSGPFARLLPVASGAIICLIGLMLTLDGLREAGFIRFDR